MRFVNQPHIILSPVRRPLRINWKLVAILFGPFFVTIFFIYCMVKAVHP